jgi:rod shape-determining protein MreD
MRAPDALRIALLVFVASILQTAVFADVDLLGGTPDLLLVTLVAVALVRGSLTGAVAGFCAGLVVDTALLGTLGVTSLLLTFAGFWTGRYAETTVREHRFTPYLAIAVMTPLYLLAELVVRFLLAEPAPVQSVLIASLLQTIVLNVFLMWPVWVLVRRLLPAPAGSGGFARGVSALG